MKKSDQKSESLTPKKLGYKVTQVNFEQKGERKFKDAVGLCEFNEKRIYIDKTLPEQNFGSKKLCLNHELVHARIGHLLYEAKISPDNEERYVEIEAICWTAMRYLSAGEIEIKKNMTNGSKLNMRKIGHRKRIITNIFAFLNIKHVKDDLIERLAEKVIDRGD